MKYLLMLFLVYTLQAKETCYTVQILSVNFPEKTKQLFTQHNYDDSCQLMHIGDYSTVRCGCFEKIKSAEKILPKLRQKYPSALVKKTYKSRFIHKKSTSIVKTIPIKQHTPIVKTTSLKQPTPHKKLIAEVAIHENSSYEQAKGLFQNKKYKEAYDAFYTLFLNDLQNPNINFYLGRSAYMLQEYELAISAYERVLNFNENATRSKLEIAKCYFELKDYKKSKTIFLEAMKDHVPTNVKQNINLYLQAIESKTKKHFFNGSVVAGVNYDTNIYNRANDDVFTIPGIIDTITNQPIKAQNSTQNESGFAHQEALSLNHLYIVNNTMNIKNDFVVFLKSIAGNRSQDIGLIQYSPALSVTYKNRLLVDYALLANKVWVHSKPFMTNYGIYPKLQYVYSASTILGSGYKYQKKTTDTLTAQNQTLEFNVRNIYSDSLMFMLYGQFFIEKKLSGQLDNVDYKMFNFYLSSAYKYTPSLSFTPKIQWYTKTYKDKDLLYLKKRKDNEYQFSLNSTYEYNQKVLFSLDYAYIQHISNIPSWEFNKQSVTTNVIYLF